MRISIKTYPIVLLVLATFWSCMNDAEWAKRHQNFDQEPGRGLFVVCEGNFMFGNASLSFYNIDKKEVRTQIFSEVNGLPLGDVAHSITLYDTLAFVVINNSGKIYVINTLNFQYVGKITGLTSPRYIEIMNDRKAYVSDLKAQSITIVDPLGENFQKTRVAQGEITGRIDLKNKASKFSQHPSEQFIRVGNKLFTNCWSYDNQIMVIDTQTDTVIDSIAVGKQPASMVLDANDNLWVFCDGGYKNSPYGQEPASIYKVSTPNHQAEKIFQLNESIGSNLQYAADLAINATRDTVYFVANGIRRFSIYNPQPELFLPANGEIFHSLTVDPITSEVYAANAIDYTQSGVVYRFSSQGIPIDTFRVGINPGAFAFRK